MSPDEKSLHISTTATTRRRKRRSPGSVPSRAVWKSQPHWVIADWLGLMEPARGESCPSGQRRGPAAPGEPLVRKSCAQIITSVYRGPLRKPLFCSPCAVNCCSARTKTPTHSLLVSNDALSKNEDVRSGHFFFGVILIFFSFSAFCYLKKKKRSKF